MTMSIESQRVVCTGCDFETRELYRPIRVQYQLASGKVIEVGRRKGWCYTCDTLVEIEDMDPGEIQKRLDRKEAECATVRHALTKLKRGFLGRLKRFAAIRSKQYVLAYLTADAETLRDQLTIAVTRTSGPRCLACWGESTAPVTFSGPDNATKDFQHHCGGQLRKLRREDGEPPQLRVHFATTTLVLDPEGRPLLSEGSQ
jgi:hypothetical protein